LSFALPLVLLLAAGCATPPPTTHYSASAQSFPAEGFLVGRALLTIHGREFALNGYLALSPSGGKRFVVTENLGATLADVLVKPDGRVYIMKPNRLFPEKYVRRFMVPDLECVFGGAPPSANCPVTVVSANHFVIDRGNYRLDLRIVQTTPGPQSPTLFDETHAQ
jgi:hypothetical protein